MDRAEWVRATAMFEPSDAPRSRPGDWLAILHRDPRQAVEEERIICLICGARFRQLTNTHLKGHALSALEYKRRFGYNRGQPHPPVSGRMITPPACTFLATLAASSTSK